MAHRDRLSPDPDQTAMLERHGADARLVWNLALEQLSLRLPGRRPGSAERFRPLAEARKGTWLGEGSSSVQPQALRDFQGAVANWRLGTHRWPRWRRRGLGEGVGGRDVHVRVVSRRSAQITGHAHINAATSILAAGLALTARDGTPLKGPGEMRTTWIAA